MYNIVLLDADGTLFDYNKAEKYALYETLMKFNYVGNIDQVKHKYRDINKNLWLELENGEITKDKLRTERFRRLFIELQLEFDVKKISDYYINKLAEGSFLIDGAKEICEYLSSRYILVIITNGMKEVQLSRIERSVLRPCISEIVVSEDAGVNKPNPYIYEYTLKRLNHNCKKDIIMIGDSLSSDVQGGINYGIDTCWFNSDNVENITTIRPTYEINELKDLFSLL